MTHRHTARALCLLTAALVGTVPSCASRMTAAQAQDRYNRVTKGMTVAQVVELMGREKERHQAIGDGGTAHIRLWHVKDAEKTWLFSICFNGAGLVIAKEHGYYDPAIKRQTMWPDRTP